MFGGLSLHVCVLLEIIYRQKKNYFSVVNLATEAAISESAVMRHAVSLVNELGVLSLQSGKFHTIFAGAASNLYDRVIKLRPLCATRMTVRAEAIQHVLDQYELILEALEEMAKSQGDAAAKAAGLLAKFQEGNTYLSLILAVDVISQLEVFFASEEANYEWDESCS